MFYYGVNSLWCLIFFFSEWKAIELSAVFWMAVRIVMASVRLVSGEILVIVAGLWRVPGDTWCLSEHEKKYAEFVCQVLLQQSGKYSLGSGYVVFLHFPIRRLRDSYQTCKNTSANLIRISKIAEIKNTWPVAKRFPGFQSIWILKIVWR